MTTLNAKSAKSNNAEQEFKSESIKVSTDDVSEFFILNFLMNDNGVDVLISLDYHPEANTAIKFFIEIIV